jgi:hypothetical protein
MAMLFGAVSPMKETAPTTLVARDWPERQVFVINSNRRCLEAGTDSESPSVGVWRRDGVEEATRVAQRWKILASINWQRLTGLVDDSRWHFTWSRRWLFVASQKWHFGRSTFSQAVGRGDDAVRRAKAAWAGAVVPQWSGHALNPSWALELTGHRPRKVSPRNQRHFQTSHLGYTVQ